MVEDWTATAGPFERLDPATRAALAGTGRIIVLPAGARAFAPGTACESYLVVLEGAIRVQMVAANGREIVLYRVEAGQSCILTTACLLARDDYPAEAVVERAATVAAVPAAAFQALLGRSQALRDFVFAEFGSRLLDLMLVFEEVAFRRIDLRLARCLIERCDPAGILRVSHQELSVELGTAREVVSRQLKDFEQRGWITLERRRIAVLDAGALAALAADANEGRPR